MVPALPPLRDDRVLLHRRDAFRRRGHSEELPRGHAGDDKEARRGGGGCRAFPPAAAGAAAMPWPAGRFKTTVAASWV